MSNFFGPGSVPGGGSGIAQVVSLSQDQQCNGYKITELGNPVSATDAANKAYVDATAGGGGSSTLAAVLLQGNDADGQNMENIGTIVCQEINSGTNATLSIRDTIDLGGVYKVQNSANPSAAQDLVTLNTLTSTLGSYVPYTAAGSIQMGGFNVSNAAIVSSYKFKSPDGINQSMIWFTGGLPLSDSILNIGPTDQSSYTIRCNTDEGQVDVPQLNCDSLGNITGNPVNVQGGIKIDQIVDNSNSSGTANQVLSCGSGGQVQWVSSAASGVHSVQQGNGVSINQTDPQNPVVNANVAQIQAGSNVSVSNVGGTYTISATAATGVSTISSSNLGITIANPTSSPVLTPKYIGAATFQFDSTTPASGVTTAPNGSITIWYTPLTPLATAILTQYYTGLPNLALQIKYTPSIYVQGFAQGNADYLYFDVITDAGGQSPGADNNRFWNNIQDFPVSCDFQLTTQTNNGFSNANNTKVGLVIQNGCTIGGAAIFMATIPNVIRFDVFDPSNFS